MTQPRTLAVIGVAAALIGLIADQLFRAPVWGINVTLAAAMLAAAGLAMPSAEGRAPWPWLASVFFAGMWTVRESEPLLPVDLMAALALASLPLLQERGVMLRTMHLIELGLAPLRSFLATTFGTLDFANLVRVRAFPGRVSGGHAKAIGAGALLATPLVLIFGGLFASADPVFDTAVSSVMTGHLGPIISHTITAGALAWASAGYLWVLAKPPRAYKAIVEIPEIGGIQVLTPLVATVALFATFVGVQASSLFGGATFVETTTGLTFAEYARGGFFQLVFASTLVLPLVYFAPAIAGPLDERATLLLRRLLGIQLGLTALVLASALWRMALYVRAYGLTIDRVNGTAVMVWIAATLGVLAFTVVRGRPQAAAFGSLIGAVVALGALNLVNPTALIARYNLNHQNGREIDFQHLAGLGGDAVPALVSQIDLVPAELRCALVDKLRERYLVPAGDWRGWNLSRQRAHEATQKLDAVAANCVTSSILGAP